MEKKVTAFDLAFSHHVNRVQASNSDFRGIDLNFSSFQDMFPRLLVLEHPDWKPDRRVYALGRDTFGVAFALSRDVLAEVTFAFRRASDVSLDLTVVIRTKGLSMKTLASGKKRVALTKAGQILHSRDEFDKFLTSKVSQLTLSLLKKIRHVPVGDVTRVVSFLKASAGLRLFQEDLRSGSWLFEPYNRQQSDHFGAYWEEDYANPLAASVQKQLDKEFGQGLFDVFVTEKGFVDVRVTTLGRKHFAL